MKVFISYRREDSQYITDRIYDWVEREFGRADVFKDVYSLRLGWDYRLDLQDAVARCDVLLVVIGLRWLSETDAAGRRQMDDPGDWVRIEIETALTRKIPVIPLLVDGASFPCAEDLPPSLQELVYREGMQVRPGPDFHTDMGRLIKALREIVPSSNAVKISDESFPRILAVHTSLVSSVAFSPDGATLASASGDTTIRLWRVSDGSPLRTLAGHTADVRSVAFSPNGATLASGAGTEFLFRKEDCTVRLWRVSDGSPLRTLKGHTGFVGSVAFSPDGATLASGSADKTVRLWSIPDGRLLRTLVGHTDWVLSVAFSPDGATLASGAGGVRKLLFSNSTVSGPNTVELISVA